jgi:hypothetical protein
MGSGAGRQDGRASGAELLCRLETVGGEQEEESGEEVNTPPPCDTCAHLYSNVLCEDDPTYSAECTNGLPMGVADCKNYESWELAQCICRPAAPSWCPGCEQLRRDLAQVTRERDEAVKRAEVGAKTLAWVVTQTKGYVPRVWLWLRGCGRYDSDNIVPVNIKEAANLYYALAEAAWEQEHGEEEA